MAFWILSAGLILLTLTNTIVIEPFLSIIHNTKETIALIICFLFFTYVYNFKHKRLFQINKSLSLFVFFAIFSINASPKIKLIYNTQNLGNFWEWKALAVILAYYLFYLSFSHVRFSLKEKEKLCKVLATTAIISSIYAILQALGLDQAQSTKTIQQIGTPVAPGITAMIGNPTYLGIYLTACLPFVWHFFKKPVSIIVLTAIALSGSDTAYLGMLLMAFLWVFSSTGKNGKIVLSFFGFLLCVILAFYHPKVTDSGRFNQWKQSLSEFYNPPISMNITPEMSTAQKEEIQKLNTKKYTITGLGLGSFPIFHNANKKFTNPSTAWMSAHNVFLEVLFTTGILGLLIFLSAIFETFFSYFKKQNKNKIDGLAFISFIFLLLSFFTTSTILLEPLRFLTVIFFCLISF